MKILLICVLAVLGAYIVFVFAPALVMYKCIFGRQPSLSLLERDLDSMGLGGHEDTLRAAFRYFEELPGEDVSITTADGVTLTGRYYPRGQGKAVICMHGYRSSPLNGFAVMGRFLSQQGWDVLLVHQRGHGESGGKYTSLGILEQEDVLAWTRWVCERPYVDRVVLAGVSMGCTAVAYASDRLDDPKVKAMILDCGFTSPDIQITSAFRSRHLPTGVLMPLIRAAAKLWMRVDITTPTWTSLERAALPALFLHGELDEMVPLDCTRRNYDACASPKQLCVVENGHHADAFLMGGEETARLLTGFLNTYTTNCREGVSKQ